MNLKEEAGTATPGMVSQTGQPRRLSKTPANLWFALEVQREILNSSPTISMGARHRHVLHVDTMYNTAAKYVLKCRVCTRFTMYEHGSMAFYYKCQRRVSTRFTMYEHGRQIRFEAPCSYTVYHV